LPMGKPGGSGCQNSRPRREYSMIAALCFLRESRTFPFPHDHPGRKQRAPAVRTYRAGSLRFARGRRDDSHACGWRDANGRTTAKRPFSQARLAVDLGALSCPPRTARPGSLRFAQGRRDAARKTAHPSCVASPLHSAQAGHVRSPRRVRMAYPPRRAQEARMLR
jgi:hypothetical protein